MKPEVILLFVIAILLVAMTWMMGVGVSEVVEKMRHYNSQVRCIQDVVAEAADSRRIIESIVERGNSASVRAM